MVSVTIKEGVATVKLPYLDLTAAAQRICDFEGFRAKPYRDSGGVPTIGCGTTRYPSGRKVSMGDPGITFQIALGYLEHDLEDCAHALWMALKREPAPEQWAAMLSLAYNEGVDKIIGSTLVRLFEAGDFSGAADQFLRWKYDHHGDQLVEVEGLLNRRRAERALFLSGSTQKDTQDVSS